MSRWAVAEVEYLKQNSSKDNWKTEEELSIILGRKRTQINKERWVLGLKRSPEQRRIHDYICKNCDNHFYNKSIGRKFCSEECHRIWQQKHIFQKTYTKTCLYCLKTFEARYSTRKFCSNECYYHVRCKYIVKDKQTGKFIKVIKKSEEE